MRVSIQNVGEIGVVRDTPPHALPPNAWTAARNVRFRDGVAMPTGREFPLLGPLQIESHWLHNAKTHWVYAGPRTDFLMGVWAINSFGSHIELSTSVVPAWSVGISLVSGGNINGLTVLSNVADSPVYWVGVDATTNKLAWLPWDATDTWKDKNWTAKAVRPHKRWLFALGTVEDGTVHPQRIRNSAAAPPGAIPATWDDTDLTQDAAFVDDPAADRYDMVDGLSMGDEFVACTNQTTWVGQATGIADAPFQFRKVFDHVGVLTTDCMAAVGRRQYLLTQDDVVVHDGSRVESLLTNTFRRWLFRNIDVANFSSSFLYYSRVTDELWVCFPGLGATHCTTALVIQLSGSPRIGVRDLPNLRKIDMGPSFETPLVWTFDTADFAYAVSDFPYSYTSQARDTEKRIAVSPTDLSGFQCLEHYADTTNPSANVPRCSIERQHLVFPESDGALRAGRVLRCTAIYPQFSRLPDGPVEVYLGTARTVDDPMTWYGPKLYEPHNSRTNRVTFREQGAYLGVRFATEDGSDWQLSGYDMDIQPLGYRA